MTAGKCNEQKTVAGSDVIVDPSYNSGCSKSQEPMREELHSINFAWIVLAYALQYMLILKIYAFSLFLRILLKIFRATHLLNIFPLVPDFSDTL